MSLRRWAPASDSRRRIARGRIPTTCRRRLMRGRRSTHRGWLARHGPLD